MKSMYCKIPKIHDFWEVLSDVNMPSLTSLKCGLRLKFVENQSMYLRWCIYLHWERSTLRVFTWLKSISKHIPTTIPYWILTCMEFEFFIFFCALPSFLHPRSESYNYPKMAILAIFCKKVRLKKLIFGFKTAPKCSTFQEKVSLIKGFHQKKFGTSKVKIKNFISKKRTPPKSLGYLGGGKLKCILGKSDLAWYACDAWLGKVGGGNRFEWKKTPTEVGFWISLF